MAATARVHMAVRMRKVLQAAGLVHRGQTRHFSFFFLVGFRLILSEKWARMNKKVSLCTYLFLFFFKKMSFFSLKTDQNCLGLKKIMLANGADKSAVHSFNEIKEIYSPCLFYVVLLGDFIVLERFENFCRSLHKTESRLVTFRKSCFSPKFEFPYVH